jgi:cysteine-rich repeat protein
MVGRRAAFATLIAAAVSVGACSRSALRAAPEETDGAAGGAGGGGTPSFCGNGVVEPGEECDDGNASAIDGCTPQCTLTGCGDGVLGPGEECDLGPANGDLPPFILEQGSVTTPVLPVVTIPPSWLFYDYFSYSAHTGFEALESSRAFLLHAVETQTLSLVMVHGIDFETSGQAQPASAVDFAIDGIPLGAFVSLYDDYEDEFFMTSSTTALGLWTFEVNSDGGVLDGLAFPGSWAITITPDFIAGIDQWAFVDSDGELVSLDLASPITLRSFAEPSACRLDCTQPRCGDGIIDAGEVCDGPVPAAGCSPDCQSLTFP